MVWIAAGGGAIAATYVLFKCYQHTRTSNPNKIKRHEITLENLHDGPKKSLVEMKSDNVDEDQEATEVLKLATSLSQGAFDRLPQSTIAVIKPPATSANGSLSIPVVTSLSPRLRSPPRLKPPSFGSMSPPPTRNSATSSLRPPPSAASQLRVPATKVLPNASMAPSSLMPPPSKPSRQVILKPGHSPLDWAVLSSSPTARLRGKDVPENLIKVTPSQLKHHTGRRGKDAWTVYQGKVYNITPYLPFHPGGEPELMKSAGRDAGKLFMEVHPWVNWEGMLGNCMVGILVSEGELEKSADSRSGGLDDMD